MSRCGTAVQADGAEPAAGVSRKKRLGQFFTPIEVAQFMFDAVRLDPAWSVIDPACGEGVFLLEARRRGARRLVGLERDRAAMDRCRAALGPRPHDALVEQDGLAEITVAGVPRGGYDLAIGNPPFNSGRHRDPGADAACVRHAGELPSLGKHAGLLFDAAPLGGTGRGDWEIEAAFLLRFLSLVRPGGRVAVILPKGFFANRKLRVFRAGLLCDCAVDAVVELPAGAFASSGTQVRAAVLLLKKQPAAPRSRTVVAKVSDVRELEHVSSVLTGRQEQRLQD